MDGTELVVGFDESAGARSALAWAIAEGASTGRQVRAVHALSWPYGPYAPASARTLTHEELDRRYTEAVTAAFTEVADETGAVLEVVRGDAGPALVTRAQGATALVVGRPAHAGVSRLLVGSVAHHCLTHAPCPVVTVPIERRAERSPGSGTPEAGLRSATGSRP